MTNFNCQITKFAGATLVAALLPQAGWACACGCGVFDVGTSWMLPSGQGGMAFLNYDFQDQNRNWEGTSTAPDENNSDKEIRTDFFSLGLQYMVNYKWGIEAELPYDYRTFKTADPGGNLVTRSWSQVGDIRLRGIYTGFSPDQIGRASWRVRV